MRILILNWRDVMHPLAGGAEASLFKHAQYWVKKGAEVIWISSNFPRAQQQETKKGIKFIRFGSHYTVHIRAMLYIIKNLKNKIDIVVDCFHFVPYFSPLYIKQKKIVALINEPAKNAWFKNIIFPLSSVGFFLERYFFLLYKKVPFITAAASISDELQSYGIQAKNITIIFHGFTAKNVKSKRKEKNPTIIYLSQLSADKGIEDAIKTFTILKKNQENINFWVVGKEKTKEYGKKVRGLAKKEGVIEDVVFWGYVSDKKKIQLLTKSWILIHPSIREGWGLNVIEANSCGIPAVAYNVTGLRDSIQHQKTGILTEKNTPLHLANCIQMLIDDSNLYKKLSEEAVLWASTFSWDHAGSMSWKLISDIYKENE